MTGTMRKELARPRVSGETKRKPRGRIGGVFDGTGQAGGGAGQRGREGRKGNGGREKVGKRRGIKSCW